jgi:dolichyl-phosphate beta-glucosyltransferase
MLNDSVPVSNNAEFYMETKLSIVIPAYNEALRIGKTLDRICVYLEGRGYPHEIIVVDDGSTDATDEVVRKSMEHHPAISVLRNDGNMGKGYSVRRGVLRSKGASVLLSDADLSTPIEEVEKLDQALEEGFDIAIGSRAVSGSRILKKQPWYRQFMGMTFNTFIRALAVIEIRDTQCGFKLFTGDAAKRVFALQRIERFAFDVEALYLAKKMGFGIKEVPVVWIHSPDSKVGIFKDSLQMMRDLLKIRLHRYKL